MLSWYTTVLNTGHCDVTPLMTLSIYGPIFIVALVLQYLLFKFVQGAKS